MALHMICAYRCCGVLAGIRVENMGCSGLEIDVRNVQRWQALRCLESAEYTW